MANERLTDMTAQELLDAALANPAVAKAIVDSDPRVSLFERVYKVPEYREQIEAMGVAVAPDSTIARSRRHAAAAIADDVAAVKSLRKELEDERLTSTRARFRDGLRDSARALGFETKDEDLDAIETFMTENHYGPKAASVAVEKFYETREAAEPNFENEHSFQFPDEGSEYIKQLTAAGPGVDTSMLTLRHAEKTWREMFGDAGKGARRPAFTA